MHLHCTCPSSARLIPMASSQLSTAQEKLFGPRCAMLFATSTHPIRFRRVRLTHSFKTSFNCHQLNLVHISSHLIPSHPYLTPAHRSVYCRLRTSFLRYPVRHVLCRSREASQSESPPGTSSPDTPSLTPLPRKPSPPFATRSLARYPSNLLFPSTPPRRRRLSPPSLSPRHLRLLHLSRRNTFPTVPPRGRTLFPVQSLPPTSVADQRSLEPL
jgi:hypothetical protein